MVTSVGNAWVHLSHNPLHLKYVLTEDLKELTQEEKLSILIGKDL
jgi:hypothetical protein